MVKLMLKLEQAIEAQEGSRGIAVVGWMVNITARPLYSWERDLVPIVQEARWAPGKVRTGAGNIVPTGIRSPDRSARIQNASIV